MPGLVGFVARSRSLACLCVALAASLTFVGKAGAVSEMARVKAALTAAKTNRVELEQVLHHYQALGDPQKLEAARFLIANMEGRGFVVTALLDEKKQEIFFDALSYPGFGEAQKALDELEKKHGKLEFGRKRFVPDLEVIHADYLIENIDLAFEAWRTKPWAQKVNFPVFLETILPYRGNKEPIEPWRAACLQRYADLPGRMKDPHDLREAADRIMGDVGGWVQFSDLYYLHPTDQGFGEMDAGGRGRCGDIATMTGYALRANAIPAATDYTPFWADRDNNHAWTVILNQKGEGRAGLAHRAAKIYRQTYSHQMGNLAFQTNATEKVPRWLDRPAYQDVTAQYMDTTDVTLKLKVAVPRGARFAYLCVFNEAEWHPIHWGRINVRRVTFTRMGRNICYLPAYYVDEKLVPAGPPFILDKAGAVQVLDEGGKKEKKQTAVQLNATTPSLTSPDTRVISPVARLNKGKKYELLAWHDGWEPLYQIENAATAQALEQVREGRLYWLLEDGSRKLERIFTINRGQQVWW